MEGHKETTTPLVSIERDDKVILESEGNDRGIEIWDMKEQRCIKTSKAHYGSIWALETARENGTA